ncbi:MAG: hypothetical protein ABI858_05430 [Pseudoxanthomonas sp.]
MLGPNDVYALINAAGLEVRNEYFERLAPGRYFPLVVVAWDADAGKESRYTFDYVEVVSQLKGTNDYQGYPFYKNLLVDFFVEAQAKTNQLGAVDLQAIRAARQMDVAEAKVKALRVSAGYGGIQSLRAWIAICAVRPFKGCGDGLEDILLGLSEQKRVTPMVMLAFLHAENIVAKRNEAVADGLLSAAIRLSSEEDVALEYLVLSRSAEHPKATARKSLAGAMAQPSVLAALAAEKVQKREPLLPERDLQALAATSSNAVGAGQSWLSQYLLQQEKEERQLEAMRLATEAGDSAAQQARAYYLISKSPQTSISQALALMESAAQGGEAAAMRYLSTRSRILQEWKSSERWLMGAVKAGDGDAMLSLAGLYEQDHADVGQTAKQAFDWYVTMSANPGAAEARRRAARMAIKGKGTAKDSARAEKWLLQDAQANDHASQLLLAIGYLDGDHGAESVTKAKPWIEKILVSDDRDAKVGYADWLYHKGKSVEDRALAKRLWADGQQDEASWALNNMAWAYCTSVDPAARNPALGLQYSEEMLKNADLDWGKLDTVAACQAANGDYPTAAQTQQRVIAQFFRYWSLDSLPPDKDENGYDARLKLYQHNKPYLDERAGLSGN